MLALHRTIPTKWGDRTCRRTRCILIVDWLVDRITDPGEEGRHLRSMCNNEYTPMVRHLLLVTAQRGSTSALYPASWISAYPNTAEELQVVQQECGG